jgi:ABC-type glycerol-3-phosphate transport system substrate-binding protein
MELLLLLDACHRAGADRVTAVTPYFGYARQDQAALGKFLAVAFGEASMTIASSASLGEIYNQLDLFPDVELRVGPFPGLLGGRTAVGGGSLYLVADTTDAERAAAWDLMVWLNEPTQQVRWSTGTGYIPTREFAIDDPALQELCRERHGYRVAFDQLAKPGELPGGGGPVVGHHLGFRDAIEDGLEALYDGTDSAVVQAQMQAAADATLADYNRRIGD